MRWHFSGFGRLCSIYSKTCVARNWGGGLEIAMGVEKRDGKAIEELGYYNPFTKETYLKVNEIKSRLQTGAQPTETVRNIFKKAKILDSV